MVVGPLVAKSHLLNDSALCSIHTAINGFFGWTRCTLGYFRGPCCLAFEHLADSQRKTSSDSPGLCFRSSPFQPISVTVRKRCQPGMACLDLA